MIILNFLINRDKFGDRSNRMDNMDNMVVFFFVFFCAIGSTSY